MIDESMCICTDNATLVPYRREEGQLGYILTPHSLEAMRMLTNEECHELLTVYDALLTRKEIKPKPEVVRCKDCKWFSTLKTKDCDIKYCGKHILDSYCFNNENWFCADGERKAE